MLKLWKGLNSWSLDQVAGTLKENPYWGFWGCGLMMERYRFLPKAALFAAASFLPSPSSWFATPAGEVLTWLFGEHQPHLRSPGWIAARPCANLQRHPAAASLLWDSLHLLPFPARFSVETTGRVSHVPWGAAGPVSSQGAAFPGSRAFPEEGEERDGVLSLAGKTNGRAVCETMFLRCCVRHWPPDPAHVENQSRSSAGIKLKVYC